MTSMRIIPGSLAPRGLLLAVPLFLVCGETAAPPERIEPQITSACDAPEAGWLWCDDFELNRLDRYFEVSDVGGSFVRADGVGRDGSYGMRARFEEGQVNAGDLHLAVGRTPQAYFRPADDGTADHRDLYWRFYLRNQDGWTGGGGFKLTRATSFVSESTWAQAMAALVWSTWEAPDHLAIDPASGTDPSGQVMTSSYNDVDNWRWLGARRGTTPVFDSFYVGVWHCIEVRVRLNDPGLTNGVFELWIDDGLEASRNDLNWVGAFNGYGINAVFLENYWNQGSPVAQERYFDDFVVSTRRIGCEDD